MCSKPKPIAAAPAPPPPPPVPPKLQSPTEDTATDSAVKSRKGGSFRRSLRVDLGGVGGLKIK